MARLGALPRVLKKCTRSWRFLAATAAIGFIGIESDTPIHVKSDDVGEDQTRPVSLRCDATSSVGFPVASQAVVEVIMFSEPELDRIEGRRAGQIDPPPHVAPAGALTAPPLAAASHGLRGRREMLHQKTGVDCDKDSRCKVAQEAQKLTGGIRVIEGGFLRESASPRLSHGRDDSR